MFYNLHKSVYSSYLNNVKFLHSFFIRNQHNQTSKILLLTLLIVRTTLLQRRLWLSKWCKSMSFIFKDSHHSYSRTLIIHIQGTIRSYTRNYHSYSRNRHSYSRYYSFIYSNFIFIHISIILPIFIFIKNILLHYLDNILTSFNRPCDGLRSYTGWEMFYNK